MQGVAGRCALDVASMTTTPASLGASHERDHQVIVEVAQTIPPERIVGAAVHRRPEGIVNAVRLTPQGPHFAEGETLVHFADAGHKLMTYRKVRGSNTSLARLEFQLPETQIQTRCVCGLQISLHLLCKVDTDTQSSTTYQHQPLITVAEVVSCVLWRVGGGWWVVPEVPHRSIMSRHRSTHYSSMTKHARKNNRRRGHVKIHETHQKQKTRR